MRTLLFLMLVVGSINAQSHDPFWWWWIGGSLQEQELEVLRLLDLESNWIDAAACSRSEFLDCARQILENALV